MLFYERVEGFLVLKLAQFRLKIILYYYVKYTGVR